MIILKLKIRPVTVDRLKKVVINPPKRNLSLTDLTEVHKRDFKGDLTQENLQWIKNVQEHDFGDVNIKDIHTNGCIPAYLDENKQYYEFPTPVSRKELEDYVKRLSDYIKKLKEKIKEIQAKKDITSSEQSKIDEIEELIRKLKNKRSAVRRGLRRNRGSVLRIPCRKIRLFGYYTRNGRNSQPNKREPEVVLLMDSIGKDNNSLLISTYIHEMFHAYYDFDWLKLSQNDLDKANLKYPKHVDLKYIEEPLTEYAMLKFLEDFEGKDQDKRHAVLAKVPDIISNKRFNSCICHYGLGYYLWKWEKKGGKLPNGNWIQNYKNVKSKENLLDQEFIAPFKKGLYPFGSELHYMALLYKLIAEADGQQLGDVATIEAELNNQNIQVF